MNFQNVAPHRIAGISAVQKAVEDVLPAHIMSVAIDKLYQNGFELRLDTRGYLNNAIMAVLRRHTGQELVIAQRADAMADDILRPIAFDDAQTVLLAASYFLLKLVDEELFLDKNNQAVLSALMIVTDADSDENPEWHHLVPSARAKAGQLLSECLNRGLYSHAVVKN